MKNYKKLKPRYLTKGWTDKDTLIENYVFELATLYFEEEEPDWCKDETKIIKKAVDWWKIHDWHTKISDFLSKYQQDLYKKYGFDDIWTAMFITTEESKILVFREESEYMSPEDLNKFNRAKLLHQRVADMEKERTDRHLENIIRCRKVLWS